MPTIVAIGGSAGSTHVLKAVLAALPADFPAAVLVVTHIGARESMLPILLEQHTALPVRHAVQGEPIVPGQVLLAPPDLHLTVVASGGRAFAQLTRGPRENHARPAIDPLFRSTAMACGGGAIAVLLSGFLDDGTVGLQAVKARGGVTLVQDPAEAEAPDMPASALAHASVDLVRRADEITPTLVQLAARALPAAAGQAAAGAAEDWVDIEDRMFEDGADIACMEKLGQQIPATCPECNGPIWEVGANPVRYRCLTGHAFTAQVLETLQREAVDEAVWAAIRALHEQEQLYLRLHQRTGGAPDEYLEKATRAREHAKRLRDLLMTSARIAPV